MITIENEYRIHTRKYGTLFKTKDLDDMTASQDVRLQRKELDHIIFAY